jgi:pimeloyl-ACP methyl ester carboxylesterase
VADNAYARSVIGGLDACGIPKGARLMLVGHSFGADTALDLAADASFGGPDGYRITHVVAAGYDSVPQLASVPGDTEVLVLQNHRDAVVIGEALFDHHVQHAAGSLAEIDS